MYFTIKKIEKLSAIMAGCIEGGEWNFLIFNAIGAFKLKRRSDCIVTTNYVSW